MIMTIQTKKFLTSLDRDNKRYLCECTAEKKK